MSQALRGAAADVPIRRRPGGGTGVLVLAAAAWVGLWLWTTGRPGAAPHPAGGHDQHAVAAADPAGFGVYLAGWTLMLVAMMLPTTRPLMVLFAATVRDRPDRTRLLLAAGAGYLGVWLLTGLAAYAGDTVLGVLVGASPWLVDRPWLLVGGALALAGAYQFVPMKLRCLEKCRSPRMFLFARWRGGRPLLDALRLGAAHGRFCVGCCWALMLVMLAAGLHSLLPMAGLAALMAVEKNASWGARIREPVGFLLLGVAALVLVLQH